MTDSILKTAIMLSIVKGGLSSTVKHADLPKAPEHLANSPIFDRVQKN